MPHILLRQILWKDTFLNQASSLKKLRVHITAIADQTMAVQNFHRLLSASFRSVFTEIPPYSSSLMSVSLGNVSAFIS